VAANSVLLIAARDDRGYELEARAVAAAGGRFEVVRFEDLGDSPPLRADIVVNAGDWPLDRFLDRLVACRAVVSYGVGLDWIDVDAASARGILVVHTPLANVDDVAVHTLALMLACSRRLLEYDDQMRAGGFRPEGWTPLRRLAGQTLGLLAFGNIPQRLVPLVEPLGMRIRAWDPYVEPERIRAAGVEPGGLEDVLASSDVVSVHVPAEPGTVGFLDGRLISQLKPGAIVLVTSRGRVYDADALADALQGGHVAAAGLDVFPEEPLPRGHSLLGCRNAILTPHIAGFSAESDLAARTAVAEAVTLIAQGGIPAGAVNATRLTRSRADVRHSSSYVL
jgi:D-3-phosphoglycerate dehydrogenase / 2-oxoglutarate reductase